MASSSSSSGEIYANSMADTGAPPPPDHPEYLLDKQFELPGWLYSAKENRPVWHDPSEAADANFPNLTEKGFWAKVSSSTALKEACRDLNDELGQTNRLADHPITLIILPNTPLRNAYEISGLLPSELGARDIRFLNRVERQTKIFDHAGAKALRTDIEGSRDLVRVDTGRLDRAVKSKIRHREEMEGQYHRADAAYKSSPTPEAHLEVLAALSRLRVACQAVEALTGASASVTRLVESLNGEAAFLDQGMNDATFMGCPVEDHPGAVGQWWIDDTGMMTTKEEDDAQGAGGDGEVAPADEHME
ncbi:unnamed protein product [Urochloa decumbens]|uniref:Uncharacterized protein n=1 Tax=Urochloa decumbens TaxID=240449 RepID=A0ABC9G2G0_9POAL